MQDRHDIKSICTAWKAVLSIRTDLACWHDGIRKRALLAALLSINEKAHFRCRACHAKEPHANYELGAGDIALKGTHHNPITVE